ncbi:MAG: hypothetical protein MK133_05280, partial [Planctomycetes bacterium]|nr:hypothetical protein [Planctomycetota bacterium]
WVSDLRGVRRRPRRLRVAKKAVTNAPKNNNRIQIQFAPGILDPEESTMATVTQNTVKTPRKISQKRPEIKVIISEFP